MRQLLCREQCLQQEEQMRKREANLVIFDKIIFSIRIWYHQQEILG